MEKTWGPFKFFSCNDVSDKISREPSRVYVCVWGLIINWRVKNKKLFIGKEEKTKKIREGDIEREARSEPSPG